MASDGGLDAEQFARLLKALAFSERLKIVQCLRNGPCCVIEVARQVDNEPTTVSHHLGVLRNAGLMVDRRQGQNII